MTNADPSPTEIELTEQDFDALPGGADFGSASMLFESDDESVWITTTPKITKWIYVLGVVMALLFGLFCWVSEHESGERFTWGQKILFLMVGGGFIVSFISWMVWSHLQLLTKCPIIKFDRATSRVSIFAGRQTFAGSEVVCLLAFKHYIEGGQENSWGNDLRLIVERNGERERYLLIVGPCEHFASVLRPLAKNCEIPVLMGEDVGRIKGTESKLQRL